MNTINSSMFQIGSISCSLWSTWITSRRRHSFRLQHISALWQRVTKMHASFSAVRKQMLKFAKVIFDLSSLLRHYPFQQVSASLMVKSKTSKYQLSINPNFMKNLTFKIKFFLQGPFWKDFCRKNFFLQNSELSKKVNLLLHIVLWTCYRCHNVVLSQFKGTPDFPRFEALLSKITFENSSLFLTFFLTRNFCTKKIRTFPFQQLFYLYAMKFQIFPHPSPWDRLFSESLLFTLSPTKLFHWLVGRRAWWWDL